MNSSLHFLISKIRLYPVKSCRSLVVDSCFVRDGVFEYDRFWGILSVETNQVVSQKVFPKMTQLQPSILDFELGTLRISSCIDQSFVDVPSVRLVDPSDETVEDGDDFITNPPRISVVCRGRSLECYDMGDEAAAFLSSFLEADVRLIRMCDNTRHVEECVNDDYGSAISFDEFGGDRLSLDEDLVPALNFGNRTPFCVLSDRSIAFINDNEHGLEVEEERYRCNLLVDNVQEPFDEDCWLHFRVGSSLEFRYVRSAPRRCVMVGMDQETGELNMKILQLMQEKRSVGGQVPDVGALVCCIVGHASGRISVGDEIEVIERKQ